MKLLELNHVEKSFDGLGVIKGIYPSVWRRGNRFCHRSFGFGKIHPAAVRHHAGDHGQRGSNIPGKAGGLDRGRKGRVRLKKDLKEIQSQYGLVFQNFQPVPHYSVMKNITDAPIHVQKRDKAQVYEEARALLKKRWGWRTRKMRIRASCPAASASAWPLPGHWR